MRRVEINPRFVVFTGFFVLLLAYSLYQARFVILGPHINIEYPQDGDLVDSKVFSATGHAENIAYISLNDRPIYIDEHGNFDEKIVAHIGLSTMSIKARDRFGRETEKIVRVVYKE
ncbi:MAG: hypothetical protein AB200_01900 [Parcubacteria bacterium C7867-005]|nr:MAG: hypothetical protein AB200_01900 [Parcubacteria bacterium C7867-005]